MTVAYHFFLKIPNFLSFLTIYPIFGKSDFFVVDDIFYHGFILIESCIPTFELEEDYFA